MQCVKTGCHAYCPQYGEWLYGDLFAIDNIYLMRVCQREREPIRPVTNIHIIAVLEWFDKDKTSMEQNSTLIGYGANFSYGGNTDD